MLGWGLLLPLTTAPQMVNYCTAVMFIALTGIIHSIKLYTYSAYVCIYVCTHIITYVHMTQSTQHYVKCNVFYVCVVVFVLNGVCTLSDLHCTGCVCV